ncbi:MAG: molybdopterin-guanine dinucleotide biosynthesis protein B [Gammaproteobacteria bacterium]|nr:molybdopterin-guanine dinucleotide biosynthesis protein B [Gammaproteobacteria bacterium]
MSSLKFNKPVLGIAAFSGTGKTQLLTQLIPALKKSGIRTAVIKHAHHDIDIDKPGKDSYKIRAAGANTVLVASDKRIALMIEKNEPCPSKIEELLQYIDPDSIDLVLVEGYKELDYKKLFLFRHNIKDRHQDIDDAVKRIMTQQNTLAIVTDLAQETLFSSLQTSKTVLDINNIEEIMNFILNYIKTETQSQSPTID